MFKLKEHGTNARTEAVAGVTTFFTMAYIIFVNPQILSQTGMNPTGVAVATIIATVVGTLVMGLVANVPYAVAPGMGLNAFFTFVVCGALKFTWQEALAMVFICGLINILITVTRLRKAIIRSIPKSLQHAIGVGIGLFIAYIGVKQAGFLVFSSTNDKETPGSQVVPALADFSEPGAIIALGGLIILVLLMAFKVKGAMLISIVATTIIALIAGYVKFEGDLVNFSQISAVKEVGFAFFGTPGFGTLFSDPTKYLAVLTTIFAFSLSDTFDTIGTFIGTGRKSGIFDEADEKALQESKGFKSKMDKALFADAVATSVGALAGTSNTTTYIESAAGIEAGGRTGLTSVVTAGLFLLCLPFASIFGIVPGVATAPVLIVVGVLMADSIRHINWSDFEEALPSFLIISVMAFAYNISYGIAAGFIFFCLIKIVRGKLAEIHPILLVSSLLFILNFVITALPI